MGSGINAEDMGELSVEHSKELTSERFFGQSFHRKLHSLANQSKQRIFNLFDEQNFEAQCLTQLFRSFEWRRKWL